MVVNATAVADAISGLLRPTAPPQGTYPFVDMVDVSPWPEHLEGPPVLGQGSPTRKSAPLVDNTNSIPGESDTRAVVRVSNLRKTSESDRVVTKSKSATTDTRVREPPCHPLTCQCVSDTFGTYPDNWGSVATSQVEVRLHYIIVIFTLASINLSLIFNVSLSVSLSVPQLGIRCYFSGGSTFTT